MPRCARIKFETAIFHIMIRSISEINMFNEDKDKLSYLEIVKKYQKIFKFKLYAYCLMDNHGHFIIDTNGSDISKIMHCINFTFARWYNHEHKRHGHLFQDRFKSKVVNNERYLRALSAYIHKNPKDIRGYENCLEKYKFSSLACYLDISKDKAGLLDYNFILSMFGKGKVEDIVEYLELVRSIDDETLKKEAEFIDEKTDYLSQNIKLVRNIEISKVIEYISKKMQIDPLLIYMKYSRDAMEARAMAVVLMRSLCGFKCSDICRVLGNITQGSVSRLSSIGVRLLDCGIYRNIIKDFIIL